MFTMQSWHWRKGLVPSIESRETEGKSARCCCPGRAVCILAHRKSPEWHRASYLYPSIGSWLFNTPLPWTHQFFYSFIIKDKPDSQRSPSVRVSSLLLYQTAFVKATGDLHSTNLMMNFTFLSHMTSAGLFTVDEFLSLKHFFFFSFCLCDYPFS